MAHTGREVMDDVPVIDQPIFPDYAGECAPSCRRCWRRTAAPAETGCLHLFVTLDKS
jgi:hypothetical protein